jgi:hypothetical protein
LSSLNLIEVPVIEEPIRRCRSRPALKSRDQRHTDLAAKLAEPLAKSRF